MNEETFIYALPVVLFAIGCATSLILKSKHLSTQIDFQALEKEKRIDFDFNATTAIITSGVASLLLASILFFAYTPKDMRHDVCNKELKECRGENKRVKSQIKEVLGLNKN